MNISRLFTLLLFFPFLFLQPSCQKTLFDSSQETHLVSGPSYEEDWKQVNELEEKGLSRDVLNKLDNLLEKAEAEKNHIQIFKIFAHQSKYLTKVDEDALNKIFNKYEEKAQVASFPLKQILYSGLAEMYYWYYQQNRWRYSNRTEILGFELENIKTWDLNTIMGKVIEHYDSSLTKTEKLQQIDISYAGEILINPKNRFAEYEKELRPTLYDLLAHRALEFYKSGEADVLSPKPNLEITKDFYQNYSSFIGFQIVSPEGFSSKMKTFETYQQLLKFHKNANNRNALLHLDLHRLEYLKNNFQLENEDSLYLSALNKLKTESKKTNAIAEINNFIAQHYFLLSQEEKNPSQKKKARKKAHQIAKENIKNFPNTFGAQQSKAFLNNLESKQLSFQSLNTYPIQDWSLIGIQHKNIATAYLKVIESPFEALKYYDLDLEDKVKLFQDQVPVFMDTIKFTEEMGLMEHTSDYALPPFKQGNYVVILSNHPGFDYDSNLFSYENIWISNLSYITRSYDRKIELRALDRSTGVPQRNLKVEAWKRSYEPSKREYIFIKKEEKYTDHDGYASFYSGENLENFAFLLTNGKDSLLSSEMFRVFHRNEQVKSRKTAHFFLDRAIYRPGQTVYFKGIIIEENGDEKKVVSGLETNIKLYDVNSREIKSMKLKTNEYGSIEGFFVLPATGLTGNFRIGNDHGSKFFSVEEYKRPTFKVQFDNISEAYKLNSTISINGDVKSYTGAAIGGAEINYSVVRNYYFPYPFYGRGFLPPGREEIIANGLTNTDSSGNFNISFKAVADPNLKKEFNPVYTYNIIVDATSENGETQGNRKEVNIGSQAFLLSSNIPDKVEKSSLKKLNISAQNLEGRPITEKVEVILQKINAPNKIFLSKEFENIDHHLIDSLKFIQMFPHLAYGNENKISNWSKRKILIQKDIQSNEDFALPEMQTGAYYLKAVSLDKTGDTVKFEKYFTIFSAEDNELPYPEAISFFPLNETMEVGETAKFVLGSSFEKLTTFWEVEVNGEIVEKKKIILNSEQKLMEIPVKEKHRGGFSVHLSLVKNNRSYSLTHSVDVPFSNKKLDVEVSTFRDALEPGSEEEWEIRIKNPDGKNADAELLVSMYDASLDQFKEHNWNFNLFKRNYSKLSWNVVNSFQKQHSMNFTKKRPPYLELPHHSFPYLNWFGFHIGYTRYFDTPQLASQEVMRNKTEMGISEEASMADVEKVAIIPTQKIKKSTLVPIRKDFRETAFFYPQLSENDSGIYSFSFTMPDVLTEWKLNAFAHTKDLKFGQTIHTLVTKKELMLFPNMPRFFRQGDSLVISTNIINMTGNHLSGEVEIQFMDALSDEKITFLLDDESNKNFEIAKNSSTSVQWKIAVPQDIELVKYRIIAKTGNFSDGEEKMIPVLSDKVLVTESLPMTIRGYSTEYFQLEKLYKFKGTKTLENHSLTLEFTANPIWYVVQALPYMMENKTENSEKVFSRFFANSLSAQIVSSNPKIKEVFDYWRTQQPDALLSNLEKNEELKSILLEESPWLMDAKDESERKKRLLILFDANRMQMEKENAIRKLQEMQLSNGGWPWFANGRDDRYMTQYILAGFGHLNKLGAFENKEAGAKKMLSRAIHYLDERMYEDFQKREGKDTNVHIGNLLIHYLYARSFFPEVEIDKKHQEAYSYYLNLVGKNWLEKPLYFKGMIALISHRNDKGELAKNILESLRQNAISDKDQGMYWKNNQSGFYWHESALATQALLIEAFKEIEPDYKSVEEMKIWLLKQKQSNNWGNSKATALACYAVVSTEKELGIDKLSTVQIELGNEKIDLKENEKEVATGYIKKSWKEGEIKREMANVKVEKNSDGLAWGALYWQYFKDIDKISHSGSTLDLHKELFIEKITETGKILLPINENHKVKIGAKIVVRIVLKTDQKMEYVHMKDLRAAGLEPVKNISGHKSQDGLYYYQSTKDTSTDFFFNHLSKGTYVFEYALRANITGDFSNGITNIQCMYAPEFTSHSKSGKIVIVE